MINLMDKICTQKVLIRNLGKLPRPLIFTNGVFDLLHRGHVNYLNQAAAKGETMIVGLNSDESAKLLGKGPERPINKAMDRATVLAGLASVTFVIIFEEKTPLNLIKLLKPDIYVKGGDYQIDSLEETEIVRSWGGISVTMPFVESYSTTKLVQLIQKIKI